MRGGLIRFSSKSNQAKSESNHQTEAPACAASIGARGTLPVSAQCVKGQFRSATAVRGTFAHLLYAEGRGPLYDNTASLSGRSSLCHLQPHPRTPC